MARSMEATVRNDTKSRKRSDRGPLVRPFCDRVSIPIAWMKLFLLRYQVMFIPATRTAYRDMTKMNEKRPIAQKA